MIMGPEFIRITEEFEDPVEQPEVEGHSQQLNLQASAETTLNKDVTSLNAVIKEMGIPRTENQKHH